MIKNLLLAAALLLLPVSAAAQTNASVRTDDAAYTFGSNSVTVMGCVEATDTMDAGDVGAVKCGADRELDVDLAQYTAGQKTMANSFPVVIASDQAAIPISGTITGTLDVGTFPDNEPFNLAQINGTTVVVGNGVTGTGSLRVTIASDNTAFSVNAIQSGTWSNRISDGSDIATVINLAGEDPLAVALVDGTGTQYSNLPTNVTQINGTTIVTGGVNGTQGVGGLAATDASVSGNPVYVGGRSGLNEPTAVSADGEIVPPWYDRFGRLVTVNGHPNTEAPITVNATSSGNTTVISAGGASTLLCIQTGSIHNRDTTNRLVALVDGAGGTTRWRGEVAAEGGGSLFDFGDHGWCLTANTALVANLDAGGNVDVNVASYYIMAQ